MRVAVIHASAGHGHTKIAESVREGLLHLGLQDSDVLLIDALDETPRWFRNFYRDSYYYSVKHAPSLWGSLYELSDHEGFYRAFVKRNRRWVNRWVGKELAQRIAKEKVDAVVSTHFMAPEILGHEKRCGRLKSFLLTVITDFYPHTFWVNPGTDHYWVMSEEGQEDLVGRGVLRDQITVGGIPISPRFRPQGRRNEICRREGLDPERFTLLVTGGSFGLGPVFRVIDALREFAAKVQVLVVCGRNEEQKRNLGKEIFPFPVKLYGFVSNMDELMEVSDLLVAKPGGSTTAESFAKEVPLAVLKPIPGQEARNARLLKERNASFFLGEPEDIKIILQGVLSYPEVLEEKKRNIRRLAKAEAALELGRFLIERVPAGR